MFLCVSFSALKGPFSARHIAVHVIFSILNFREKLNMVEGIVLKLVNQMETKNMIEKENRGYYEYVLVIMAERAIAVGTMLVISLIFRQLLPTAVFLVFFLSLRKRTGGYHADKFWQCYLLTIITYIGVVQAASMLSKNPQIMYILLLLAVLIVEVIGTVNHPNMDLDKDEMREIKKAARLLVLIEAGIVAIFAVLKMNQLYVSYMSIAIILCSSLMCIAKIIKQEVR
jgi:accessory gene regulator B